MLQLEEAARQLFADLRQAIFDLRSTGQDGAGLGAALQDLVAQFERLSGLGVQLALDPKLEGLALTAETELQLLRITQEALANVRKHASASQVGVSLGIEESVLELTISDNGAGFAPGSMPKSRWPHFGLSIMRERSEAIGAEFSLVSAPGTGTRVVVRLAVRDVV